MLYVRDSSRFTLHHAPCVTNVSRFQIYHALSVINVSRLAMHHAVSVRMSVGFHFTMLSL